MSSLTWDLRPRLVPVVASRLCPLVGVLLRVDTRSYTLSSLRDYYTLSSLRDFYASVVAMRLLAAFFARRR